MTFDPYPHLQIDLYGKGTDVVAWADAEKSMRDPEYRACKHRYIKDKSGKIRPIGELKLAQRKVKAVLRWCREKKIAARIAIGKSRKQGVSTAVAEDGYDQVKTKEIDALILAHDKETANFIYSIYNRFYQYDDLPKPAPFSGKMPSREMKFADHDGHISVETARNMYAGTGRTPQFIHCSETAKWEKGEETLTALNQAIGDNPETTQIFESTFCGEENCFLPVWRAAYDNSKLTFRQDETGKLHAEFTVTNHKEWNGYIPLFISVLDDEDARKPFLDELDRDRFAQTLDEDEKFIQRQHGATLEFLNWRRWTVKNKCRGNVDVFHQEYPVTPEEAVLASGRPRFNLQQLSRHPIEDGQVGRLRHGEDWASRIVWQPDSGGMLTKFRDPQPNHHYLIGCDTGEGSELEDESLELEKRLDKSAIEVFDIDHGNEQVAVFHGISTPEELFTPLIMIARYYNDAFVVIEANASGRVVCVKMQESYDNALLYHRDDWDIEKGRRVRGIGHRTTSSNRDIIIGMGADAITDNDVLFHSKITIEECRRFIVNKKGKATAGKGAHDDHVMAFCLARAGLRKARSIFEQQRRHDRERSPMAMAALAQIRVQQRIRSGANSYTGY